MRQRKLIVLYLVISFCISLCGCVAPELSDCSEADSVASGHRDERRFDITAMKELVQAYRDSWDHIETNLQAQIDDVLAAVDEAYAIYCRVQIDSYSDWENDALYELSNACIEDFYVSEEIAAWFFANGCKHSPDTALFEPYIEAEHIPYYLANNLSRIMAYARSDAALQSERIHDYYDLSQEADIDIDATNKRCAKIYLDMLKEMDVSEALFDLYHRDYSAAETSAAYQEIKEYFLPIRNAAEELLLYDELLTSDVLEKDPYALLEQYAERLSPSIAESAEKLFSENLYTRAEGENCYDGSFTLNLPNERGGLMYTYLDGSFYDLITVTHEFGHFHADWRDVTPIYLQNSNMDIAEAQSQSMVTLFLPYYDEIFGDDAERKQLLVLLDLLDSVISGFAVGEFEYQVTQRLETITPSETAALFAEIMEECGVYLELYQVSHLFEQPGYYISYGVSALSALEMYALASADHQEALAIYDKLSGYSCLSGENSFRDVMQSCGFTDYFAPTAIGSLAERLAPIVENVNEQENTGHEAA